MSVAPATAGDLENNNNNRVEPIAKPGPCKKSSNGGGDDRDDDGEERLLQTFRRLMRSVEDGMENRDKILLASLICQMPSSRVGSAFHDELDGLIDRVFENRGGRSVEAWVKEKRTFYMVPLVNILYDVFMDEVPTAQQLYEMLSTVGLISALQLSMVMSLPLSFSFAELEATKVRFDTEPYVSVYPNGFKDLLGSQVRFTSAATYMLGSSVACTVLLFTSSSSGIENAGSAPIRNTWWRYARLVVIFITFSAIMGTIFAFYAFNRSVFLKFPDLYVERTADGMLFPSLESSSYGMYRSWASLYLAFSFAICSVILSYAKGQAVREVV
mmetsp:Transcript_15828/g.38535  ORF Transcript_15828/g.38535 Transcript_15828/m.38535 type:complete len:328 (+) Transcript_15828:70-1053(+)